MKSSQPLALASGAGGFCVYVMRFALASCNSLAVRTYRFLLLELTAFLR